MVELIGVGKQAVIHDVLKVIGASEPAKKRARGQTLCVSEARAALDLLKGEVDDFNQGDFYPYRYFASEGFLPGYSFPRLPLAAFIPGERRTRNGQGDYLQRPRFLAISEFGPGAFIYHEGARYEVNRVSLPARDDGTGISISEIKRCEACGYLHDSNVSTSHEICEHCGSASLQTMSRMMKLLAVKTMSRPAGVTASTPTKKSANGPGTRSPRRSGSNPTVSAPAN